MTVRDTLLPGLMADRPAEPVVDTPPPTNAVGDTHGPREPHPRSCRTTPGNLPGGSWSDSCPERSYAANDGRVRASGMAEALSSGWDVVVEGGQMDIPSCYRASEWRGWRRNDGGSRSSRWAESVADGCRLVAEQACVRLSAAGVVGRIVDDELVVAAVA